MIITHLEDCVKRIEAEKQSQINVVIDKVTREIIIPHNAEKDSKRNLALQELTAERDKSIKAINEKYEKDKQLLISMGEEEKAKFKEQTIASETALVTIAYDNAVSELNKQIERFKSEE